MEYLIQFFVLIPLMGFLITLFVPYKKEKMMSAVALFTVGAHAALFFAYSVYWIFNNRTPVDLRYLEIYSSHDFSFCLYFYFDSISMGYMAVASVLTFLVVLFSKFYMHRDPGFKRLFNTILLFYFGLNMIVFAGNFETIFVGWEVLGITSFLLIAFYRDRYLPVKNALKVVSLYRLSDVSLLIAIWLCHYLLHESVTFLKLTNPSFVDGFIAQNKMYLLIIAAFFIVAAAVKSAQFPFSSWLPRAMEGPTTSSAIFYGSLSVHLGVFLLLRTYPFWEHLPLIKYFIICLGLITAIVASGIANIQATVKTQIAYSSIAQIGIIFVEVALGFHVLAIIHFAGNAFLRTYQLLVSPSVLSYLIHDQFYNFVPKTQSTSKGMMKRLQYSFYLLLMKEWNLDSFQFNFMWSPFKWIGNQVNFLSRKISFILFVSFFLCGLGYFIFSTGNDSFVFRFLTLAYSIISVLLILKAFTERGDARRAWSMLMGSQLFVILSISISEHVEWSQIAIFLSGTIVASIIGFICLKKVKDMEGDVSLNNFHGRIYEYPKLGLLFLLASLGLAGFPLTPTFLGIDLIFSHIHPDQLLLVITTAVGFVFMELSVLRIYARIFLGQHVKSYHERSYRSS